MIFVIFFWNGMTWYDETLIFLKKFDRYFLKFFRNLFFEILNLTVIFWKKFGRYFFKKIWPLFFDKKFEGYFLKKIWPLFFEKIWPLFFGKNLPVILKKKIERYFFGKKFYGYFLRILVTFFLEIFIFLRGLNDLETQDGPPINLVIKYLLSFYFIASLPVTDYWITFFIDLVVDK